MKKILIVLTTLMVAFSSAKAEGLRFLDAKNLQEAIEMAKAEDLILMVEMYRVNCPSCVRMEKLIFPSDLVGEALNSNFVGYRINGEEGDGIDVMKQYRGVAFPTLFFFKDGKFVERSVGAGVGPEEFIERIHRLFVNYDILW